MAVCCYYRTCCLSVWSLESSLLAFFIRIGMVLFLATVMGQFVNWWMRDQAAVDRDRFINHSLQVAVSTKNPSDSIRMLLEYIAKELGASRAFIYEDKKKRSSGSPTSGSRKVLILCPKESLVLNYENAKNSSLKR